MTNIGRTAITKLEDLCSVCKRMYENCRVYLRPVRVSMPGQGSYSQVNKGGNLGDVANLGISIFSWSVFPTRSSCFMSRYSYTIWPTRLTWSARDFFGPL